MNIYYLPDNTEKKNKKWIKAVDKYHLLATFFG